MERNIKIIPHLDSFKYEDEKDEIDSYFNNNSGPLLAPNHSVVERKLENHKYLQIKVQDTGIGMTYEETEKLFQKFHIVNSSRSLNKNGLGLGLYLSKQI